MIERVERLRALESLLRQNPVVAILGARQVGKTTLAAQYARRLAKPTHVFDLERRHDRARLEDPELGLQDLRGHVVLDEIQRRPDLFPTLRVLAERCYFWATHTGAELDLLVERGGRLLGYEIKRTTAPRVTRSMRTALEDLDLAQLDVIHAGSETFPLDRRIRAVAASHLLEDLPRRRT